MIGTILANVGRLIALMLVQVLVLDHLDVANGLLVPYLYVLFLLLLPFELPSAALLLIGAATGALMDLFSSTPGMHMSASVLMMFARIRVVRLLAPREGYEYGMTPSLASMGLIWFITYGGFLILVHHLWLFGVEVYRWDGLISAFGRAVLSTVFTLALCLLAQFLTARPERGRT